MATRSRRRMAPPPKGARLFFEGFEYEFAGVTDHVGAWEWRRPEGEASRYKTVTTDPAEMQRATGRELQAAVSGEQTMWMRRSPQIDAAPTDGDATKRAAYKAAVAVRDDFERLTIEHANFAIAKLSEAGARQFFYIHADPQDGRGARALRLMPPPVEHAALEIPKARAFFGKPANGKRSRARRGAGGEIATQPGTLSITQTSPEGSEGEG
jgi:hypothetical protein